MRTSASRRIFFLLMYGKGMQNTLENMIWIAYFCFYSLSTYENLLENTIWIDLRMKIYWKTQYGLHMVLLLYLYVYRDQKMLRMPFSFRLEGVFLRS